MLSVKFIIKVAIEMLAAHSALQYTECCDVLLKGDEICFVWDLH
jgi:hypothetical protein